MKSNDEIIQEYITSRGLKKNTYQTYKTILEDYSKYQNQTLQELLEEADNEEEQRIRWKHRTLKNRLIKYTNHCRNNMKITSAKTYLHIIKSFYRHYEIEIGTLPAVNMKNATINQPITYHDLPDKELIRLAVEVSDPLMRSIILFLSSTGMSKVDVLKMTVGEFITATAEYHTGGTIMQILDELLLLDNVVPTFKARRTKTNKYFITFCSPEAVHEICNYLKQRNEKQTLQLNDKLFQINGSWYTIKFERLNAYLGAGKVGSYNRFRGHMLRKFHATNLEKAGMSRTKINVLQGKSNGAVDEVYFFYDERDLKRDYLECMNELLVLSDVNSVDVFSDEYLELLNQNKQLQVQVDKLKELEVDIKNIKDDLGL